MASSLGEKGGHTGGGRLMGDTRAINTLRPRQNGRHFPDDIFKWIFLNANVWIPIKISLKFVPKGPINNIPAMVKIMFWHLPGDKPLSEPMMVRLPTHICVTRPQWVNNNISINSWRIRASWGLVIWCLICPTAMVMRKVVMLLWNVGFPCFMWALHNMIRKKSQVSRYSDTRIFCNGVSGFVNGCFVVVFGTVDWLLAPVCHSILTNLF